MVARAPTSVQVPSRQADQPGWSRIGLVAVLGFAIGVAWPKLAGIRIGPSAPTDVQAPSSAEPVATAARPASSASAAPPIVSAAPLASATPSAVPAVSGEPAAPSVNVGKGSVVACRTESGESRKGKDCGRVTGFDGIAQARLRKLAASPSAQGAEGKLSVLVTLDFSANRVSFVDIGKSSTVKSPEAFKGSLQSLFQGASLAAVDHDQPRVTLAYQATFGAAAGGAASPVGAKPAGAEASATPAPQADDSSATIVWDVAIVRDAPHSGAVVARLPRGSKVRLGESKGGWYAVKYGSGFTMDGWLYRSAIGK